MEIKDLHKWEVTFQEALSLQERLRAELIIPDEEEITTPKTVAGADIAYCPRTNRLIAGVITLSYPELEQLEKAWTILPASFPYIPGLLSFREGPALLATFSRLKETPTAVIFDGQGIAHPRGLGLASHLGLFLDIPTFGCAKKRLIGLHEPVAERAGSFSPLMSKGKIVGAALRTRAKVKPVFISPGHKIGLTGSLKIALGCCRGYRLPEPLRLAHQLVSTLRKDPDLT